MIQIFYEINNKNIQNMPIMYFIQDIYFFNISLITLFIIINIYQI